MIHSMMSFQAFWLLIGHFLMHETSVKKFNSDSQREMNEIDKIKADLTKAKEKIEELTKFEQRAKYHEEKCVKLMKVVDCKF